MKRLFILIVIVFAFYYCKEDRIEYINYTSEILLDSDSLFYGNWEYLYTLSIGGWGNCTSRQDKNLPSLNFTPIGNYEKIKDNQIVEKGKIGIFHNGNDIEIGYFLNGVKAPVEISHKISLSHKDTLILTSVLHGDDMPVIYQYFLRGKPVL